MGLYKFIAEHFNVGKIKINCVDMFGLVIITIIITMECNTIKLLIIVVYVNLIVIIAYIFSNVYSRFNFVICLVLEKH